MLKLRLFSISLSIENVYFTHTAARKPVSTPTARAPRAAASRGATGGASRIGLGGGAARGVKTSKSSDSAASDAEILKLKDQLEQLELKVSKKACTCCVWLNLI